MRSVATEWTTVRLTLGPTATPDEVELARHVFVAGLLSMRTLIFEALERPDGGVTDLEALDADITEFAETLEPRLQLEARRRGGVM